MLTPQEDLGCENLEFRCVHVHISHGGPKRDVLEKAWLGEFLSSLLLSPRSVLESGLSLEAQKTCLCCLEDFEASKQVAVLPCGHVFHEEGKRFTFASLTPRGLHLGMVSSKAASIEDMSHLSGQLCSSLTGLNACCLSPKKACSLPSLVQTRIPAAEDSTAMLFPMNFQVGCAGCQALRTGEGVILPSLKGQLAKQLATDSQS